MRLMGLLKLKTYDGSIRQFLEYIGYTKCHFLLFQKSLIVPAYDMKSLVFQLSFMKLLINDEC
jgi:hypothetical protein